MLVTVQQILEKIQELPEHYTRNVIVTKADPPAMGEVVDFEDARTHTVTVDPVESGFQITCERGPSKEEVCIHEAAFFKVLLDNKEKDSKTEAPKPKEKEVSPNLELWNKLNRPPKSALKTIGGGRLKGMSDINPQWRYKALTEQFGPCGFGWKYTINKLWLEPTGEEVVAFAMVSLYVRETEDAWSEPIPGIGGSKLVAKEKGGLYNNDEAYKMATTDAVSVAFKMLGGAADIYMGLWDGSKYRDV